MRETARGDKDRRKKAREKATEEKERGRRQERRPKSSNRFDRTSTTTTKTAISITVTQRIVIVPLLYVSVTVVTTHSRRDVAQAGKERIPLSRQLREKQRSLLRA